MSDILYCLDCLDDLDMVMGVESGNTEKWYCHKCGEYVIGYTYEELAEGLDNG